jgi:peptide/nickel transport system substrate-binding protein
MRRIMVWIGLILVIAACAPGRSGAVSSAERTGDQASQPAGVKRVTAAIAGEILELAPGAAVPGDDAFFELVHAGLVTLDDRGSARAVLAEIVPSVENGLWRLLPDGRMETDWKLRPGGRWHDGTPFTSADLVFTATVAQDKDLPAFGHIAFSSIDSIEAVDPHTVTVHWKRPYIDADTAFSRALAPPLPKHLLEKGYREDKGNVAEGSYWNEDFVGTGPFRVRQWVRGSHVLMEANADYVLGRPKIDQLEVRFIPDTKTMMANILAGSVELTLGRALDLEEALQVRDQWRSGKMDVGYKSWIAIFPQFVSPSPAVIANVRLRRALLQAIDRQQLADTIQGGMVPIAHSYISPSEDVYKDIEGLIVRYDYDPRRAGQMIEELGYTRGGDGVFRDATGQRLAVEIRTIGVTAQKAIFAVADFWQRSGVPTDSVTIPPARTTDNEYRANFPGFQIFQNPNDVNGLLRLHSSKASMPENGYRVVGNHSRYMNPEFDALIDRLFVTIPKAERTQVLRQIMRHISEQLNVMGLYYGVEPAMIADRLEHATARKVQTSAQSWNAYEWTVQSKKDELTLRS